MGKTADGQHARSPTPLQTVLLLSLTAWADYWLYRVFSYIHNDLTHAAPNIRGLNPAVASLGQWLLYAGDVWFLVGFLGMLLSIFLTLMRDYEKRSNPNGLRWASIHVSSPLYLLLPVYALFTIAIPFGSLRFVVSELRRLVMANDEDADTRKPADEAILLNDIQFYARWAVMILWAVLLGWAGFAALLRIADKRMRRNAYLVESEAVLPL